ncbi:hypothetical protein CLAFUW4_09880 [Fulvia fulva]|uniref:Uncharacterized protein n=1 Tax=Passalora fulva TaxID=5499 RepID=A0A9Q8UUF3_PASFU|nr:uncharacterized protein CLAFUR5_12359 [Fulvia fulva]KAK4615305.1 hypothetical protein CLAFUR4_09885 [Fulvia fulva]KAK4616879.1 hypothetical protein CLAFUR0_09879 [Fulvia fulva]UJO22838.1 hypothetical protein CLAFUR5_12359 [Fulvia fulva]WPV19477.1 hypothetical protein CLAFUW4_09880 [Fulvia fulva]WPV34565.1 hypothetical protein CLAFUW7_09882 [Fulvia fulva]
MPGTVKQKEMVRRRQSRTPIKVDYVIGDGPPDQQELLILEKKIADLETHNDMLNRSCKKLCDSQDALKRNFATDRFMLGENHAKEKQSWVSEVQKLKDEICRLKLQVNEKQARPKGILKSSPSRSKEEDLPRAVYLLRFERRTSQLESHADIMGACSDVESANKAAMTAYKQKCDNWGELPVTDLGVSDDLCHPRIGSPSATSSLRIKNNVPLHQSYTLPRNTCPAWPPAEDE